MEVHKCLYYERKLQLENSTMKKICICRKKDHDLTCYYLPFSTDFPGRTIYCRL